MGRRGRRISDLPLCFDSTLPPSRRASCTCGVGGMGPILSPVGGCLLGLSLCFASALPPSRRASCMRGFGAGAGIWGGCSWHPHGHSLTACPHPVFCPLLFSGTSVTWPQCGCLGLGGAMLWRQSSAHPAQLSNCLLCDSSLHPLRCVQLAAPGKTTTTLSQSRISGHLTCMPAPGSGWSSRAPCPWPASSTPTCSTRRPAARQARASPAALRSSMQCWFHWSDK